MVKPISSHCSKLSWLNIRLQTNSKFVGCQDHRSTEPKTGTSLPAQAMSHARSGVEERTGEDVSEHDGCCAGSDDGAKKIIQFFLEKPGNREPITGHRRKFSREVKTPLDRECSNDAG